jgi:plasmid stabilization system protein ParE
MAGKYTPQYLPASQCDLLSIPEFIASDSAKRAVAFVDQLDERIGQLQHQPLLGRVPRHQKLKE